MTKTNLWQEIDFDQPNHCFVFQEKQLLLIRSDKGLAIPNLSQLIHLKEQLLHFNSLENFNDARCFCAEISSEVSVEEDYLFFPLKKVFHELDHQWYPMIVKGLHIVDWDKHHKYCGSCGKTTSRTPGTYEAKCTSCNILFYPRISPSIIVRIHKGNQILMARGPHFAAGVYGLIAGYVSPGETLEQTVEREVMEEVGIKIKNIRYFGSQPWPFPDSLMVAFTADHEAGEINIDNIEIVEAGWYEADHLPGLPSSSISIARLLIDDFVLQQK